MTTISVPLNYKNPFNQQRVRTGKTAKDKASGAWNSRFANRDARAAWQKGTNKNASFPTRGNM